MAAPSPSPVSRVGAAATPCSALSAPRPGGSELCRRPLLASLRFALLAGLPPPLHPSRLLSPRAPRPQQQQQQQEEEPEPAAAVAGEPMAYSQGGGKKKVCYYYDGERPAGRGGRGWGAGPGPPGSAAAVASGRRCEGWGGGGTAARPHLNPFPTRRRPGETVHGPQRLRGCRWTPPSSVLPSPSAARSAAPKWPPLGRCRLSPSSRERPTGRLSLAPLPPAARGSGGLGVPCSGLLHPTPPPGQNPYPGRYCTQSPAASRAPPCSPLPPPSLPVPLPSPPSPAGPNVFSFLRLQPHPGPLNPWTRVGAGEQFLRVGVPSCLGHPHTAVLCGLHPSPLFAGFFERHFLRIQMRRLHFLNKN